MRIQIKTKKPIKDEDLRAIYLLSEAFKISTPRMLPHNLNFILGRYGLKVSPNTN